MSSRKSKAKIKPLVVAEVLGGKESSGAMFRVGSSVGSGQVEPEGVAEEEALLMMGVVFS